MKIWIVCCLVLLSACASLGEFQDMVFGSSSESSRKPASQSKDASGSGSVVLHEGKFNGDLAANQKGLDLGRNEFGVTSLGSNNPWSGTGPENEGSLWNGDTQDNFYFTQNTFFKVGDLVGVLVDSDVNDALNAKILSMLGDKVKSVRNIASEEVGAATAQKVSAEANKEINNERVSDALGNAVGKTVESSLKADEKFVELDEIPVRITEALPNRIFAVSGSRKILIRNAPYQVVFTGKMRHEDIGKNGKILASNVLESKMELTR